MVDYICGLFPHVVGVPPVAPPPRALFELFFASAASANQSLLFNWFDRVRTALVDVDVGMVSLLASGCLECLFLPQRLSTYAVLGECATGRVVPVNESLLAHFDKPLRQVLLVGVSACDAMALEMSFRAQSEALSYSMWALSAYRVLLPRTLLSLTSW